MMDGLMLWAVATVICCVVGYLSFWLGRQYEGIKREADASIRHYPDSLSEIPPKKDRSSDPSLHNHLRL